MSLDCIGVCDAIWDSTRDGTELTEEELRHIRGCDSCAAVLAEAQACLNAISCVKSRPAVPDCRSAVMERISRRRAVLAPVWAYACAVLVLAAVICGALFRSGGSHQAPEQAKRLVRAPVERPRQMPSPAVEPKPQPRTDEPLVVRTPLQPMPHKVGLGRHTSAPHERRAPLARPAAPPAPEPVVERPEPAVTSPADDSSALAYVTWPTGAQPDEPYQYSYTVTDSATGEVTRCAVKREGSTVEIDLESQPAQPEKKPAKESKIHEATECG